MCPRHEWKVEGDRIYCTVCGKVREVRACEHKWERTSFASWQTYPVQKCSVCGEEQGLWWGKEEHKEKQNEDS